MIEKLREFNDGLRECLPLMLFVSWLIMVCFCVKTLTMGMVK